MIRSTEFQKDSSTTTTPPLLQNKKAGTASTNEVISTSSKVVQKPTFKELMQKHSKGWEEVLLLYEYYCDAYYKAADEWYEQFKSALEDDDWISSVRKLGKYPEPQQFIFYGNFEPKSVMSEKVYNGVAKIHDKLTYKSWDINKRMTRDIQTRMSQRAPGLFLELSVEGEFKSKIGSARGKVVFSYDNRGLTIIQKEFEALFALARYTLIGFSFGETEGKVKTSPSVKIDVDDLGDLGNVTAKIKKDKIELEAKPFGKLQLDTQTGGAKVEVGAPGLEGIRAVVGWKPEKAEFVEGIKFSSKKDYKVELLIGFKAMTEKECFTIIENWRTGKESWLWEGLGIPQNIFTQKAPYNAQALYNDYMNLVVNDIMKLKGQSIQH